MPYRKLDPSQPRLELPLSELMEADQIAVWCQQCNRRASIAPTQLLARHPPDAQLEATLDRIMRCSRCGGRRSWRNGGCLAWFIERHEP